ncbi:MAG: DUF2807 domain-containing protein [Flavobacteriaceae bacterium]|nr:DUF2807 domain-containing protein [Flavobacteriaceae bacterium]
MKKYIVSILFLLSISLHSQTTITKTLGDYSILKVYNGIELELIKSEKQELVITGEKSEKVKVKNSNNTLKIYLKFPETLANGKVKIVLYYSKNINTVDANEGATITAKNFKQSQLEVKTQEGALINMVIETKHLTVKSVSAGVVKLSGTTKNQNVEVSDSGVYHGYNLKATDASIIRAAIGGKAEVNVGETLDAKIRFGGTIFYKGYPEVLKTKKVLGGTIEAKN